MKKTYCVIGDPIGHSLSPQIHDFVFQSLNLKLRYTKELVRNQDLESFVNACRKLGRPGWNITIPHKQNIMAYLDHIDEPAKQIGAVNTVLNDKGILTGFNTDMHGCCVALEKTGWKAGNQCIIMGAGGAARATIAALSKLGCKILFLFDIDESRAEVLKMEASEHTKMKINIGSLKGNNLKNALKDADLLINASPAGMWPKTDHSPVPAEMLHPRLTILDMVYNPLNTKLIQDGKKQGAKTVSGLHMLIGQALAADEIWLKQKIPEQLHDQIWDWLKGEIKNHG